MTENIACKYGIELHIATEREKILLEAIVYHMQLISLGAGRKLNDAIGKFNKLDGEAAELLRLSEIGKRYEESDGMIPFKILGENPKGKINIGDDQIR